MKIFNNGMGLERTFYECWEQIHKENAWGKYPAEDVIRFMARNFYKAKRSEIKVLDIGCGGGANTWYLVREGFDTYAFDVSPTAVKKAKELVTSMCGENHNLQLAIHNITVGNAVRMPYTDDFFDVLIDSAVIYANTIENINKSFTECHRILKSDGLLFCTGLFNAETSGRETGVEIEKNTFIDLKEGCLAGRACAHFFTENELDAIMSQNGFDLISKDKVTRTDHGGKDNIGYFICTAKKR
jgi:SAM-dependent methyltransferase